MSLFLADTPFSAVLWLALKATTILAAAALLQTLWHRRTSAATRHLTWTLVVASLLLLPIAWRVAPRWSVAISRAYGTRHDDVGRRSGDRPWVGHGGRGRGNGARRRAACALLARSDHRRRPRLSPPGWLRSASTSSASPACCCRSPSITGARDVWRRGQPRCAMVHGSRFSRTPRRRCGVQRPVRLLRSREVVLPMTFGTWAPSIVIPATADLWPDDRRRAVLLHELAHVARYDCLTQTLALIACAAYWPHPAVWWVARRLRVERELACDDRVLAAGAEAHAYAGHLLDIAYSLEGRQAPALAVSMARPSQLEGRLLAALDDARNRRSPGLVVRLTLGARGVRGGRRARRRDAESRIETAAPRPGSRRRASRAEPAPMVAARRVVECRRRRRQHGDAGQPPGHLGASTDDDAGDGPPATRRGQQHARDERPARVARRPHGSPARRSGRPGAVSHHA